MLGGYLVQASGRPRCNNWLIIDSINADTITFIVGGAAEHAMRIFIADIDLLFFLW